jgi:FkbM family methyltransferase
MTKPHSTDELRAALDSRLGDYRRSGTNDWRSLEEPATRDIELDGRPLILLGAGAVFAGDFVSHALANFDIAALIDNQRIGQRLFGRECGGDEEFRAAARARPGLVAVMCCASDGAVRHFSELATGLGVPVLSLYQAYRRMGRIPFGRDHGAPEMVERLAHANPFIDRFAGNASLRTYYCVLLHRLSWSRHWLDQIRLPYGSMYFGTDVFPVSKREVLIDGGAFDGDSIRAFDAFSGGKARAIHAFEPDAGNAAALRSAMAGRDEVSIIEAGLWSESTTLSFQVDAGVSGRFDSDGSVSVRVVALDDCGIDDVSLIKLDIESAEIPALMGGRGLIARSKPKLAIAAYHLPDDFIEIPRAILEINPDYRLALRHHSPWLTDSVIHAIAP